MMQSIQVRIAGGKAQKFACDAEGQGVFRLRGGAYQQIAGTGQTPNFKTPAALSRWLSRHIEGKVSMVRGSAVGWRGQKRSNPVKHVGRWAEVSTKEDSLDRIHSASRGVYQSALLRGNEAISGSTLRGKAKKYGARYKSSAHGLLARLRSMGYSAAVEYRGKRRVIVISDE